VCKRIVTIQQQAKETGGDVTNIKRSMVEEKKEVKLRRKREKKQQLCDSH